MQTFLSNAVIQIHGSSQQILDLVDPPSISSHGHLLFSENEEATTVYRVRAGHVTEYRILGDGYREIVSSIGGGGYAGVTLNKYYPCSAEAGNGTIIEMIPRERFAEMFRNEAAFQSNLKNYYCERQMSDEANYLCPQDDNLLAHVAEAILKIKNGYGSEIDTMCGTESVRLPRVLAFLHISASIDAVRRILHILRWRRLIAFEESGTILILDGNALQAVAAGVETTAKQTPV